MTQQQAVIKAIDILAASGIAVKFGEIYGNLKPNLTFILENVETKVKDMYIKGDTNVDQQNT
jgi:hypothetical protein